MAQFSDSQKDDWFKLGFYTPFYTNSISKSKAESLLTEATCLAYTTLLRNKD